MRSRRKIDFLAVCKASLLCKVSLPTVIEEETQNKIKEFGNEQGGKANGSIINM